MTLQEKVQAIQIVKDSPDIAYDGSFETSQGSWYITIQDGKEYITFDKMDDLKDYLKDKR